MDKPSLRRFLPIKKMREPAPVVGVLRLAGVIGQMGPMRKGLSLASLAGSIERAFKLKHLKAVALAINSPGGSPVQSALIAGRIRALAEEKEVPVFAFAEDVAASGGYWLACAADEIFVNEASIVGSIGVISGGFGFPELLKKMGVERRLHTSGERKALLDPFSREKPEDVEHLKSIQGDIHDGFKAMVSERRADKLKADESELFSGAFWTGTTAVKMGLADGIGDLRGVMRERYGDKVKLRVVTADQPWLRRRLGFSGRASSGLAGDWAGDLLAAVEERMIWNRFGL
jgi:signal peptide peptidase SppA